MCSSVSERQPQSHWKTRKLALRRAFKKARCVGSVDLLRGLTAIFAALLGENSLLAYGLAFASGEPWASALTLAICTNDFLHTQRQVSDARCRGRNNRIAIRYILKARIHSTPRAMYSENR